MIDNKKEINFEISYDTKLSRFNSIYYVIDYITNYMIIKFIILYQISKNLFK